MLSYEDDLEEEQHGSEQLWILLITLILSHIVCLVISIGWLYPPDEAPNNERMRRICTNSYRSRLTGETIWPATFLSVPDIARISKHAPYQTRGYVLTEEEQKTLSVVKDGDANILRQASKLLEDFKLNYGSLMGNRVPNEEDLTRSGKDMVEPANYAVVETLAPLKRPKALEKEKKRKNKERMDALDKLTRGDSKEHQKMFTLKRPDRSRKLSVARSAVRHADTQSITPEDEKTNKKLRKVPAKTGFRSSSVFMEPSKVASVMTKEEEKTSNNTPTRQTEELTANNKAKK